MLFNSALEYAIMMLKKDSSELNGTHLFLVYADDVDLLGRNINIIKENTKALLNEDGLEVKPKKSCLITRLRDKIIGLI
jgi:hypothetical protein